MKVDLVARQRLMEDRKNKALISGIKEAVSEAIPKAVPQEEDTQVMKLVVKNQNDPKVADLLDKIGKGLVVIYKAIKGIKVTLPKVFRVEGNVDIDTLPPVHVDNLEAIEPYFTALERRISQIATAISMMPPAKLEVPKIEMPKQSSVDLSSLLGPLQDLKKAFQKGISNEDLTDGLHRVEQAVLQLVNRPQMTTPPVTHISINALQGFVKTTSATVGTTLTTLPSYGVLSNRRSVVIYNNSGSTIYIGGSDVTTSNGIPVPASSFSPILDAGVNTIIYGIASSGGLDVRVMEISDESSGR